jgi:hypothetical protein
MGVIIYVKLVFQEQIVIVNDLNVELIIEKLYLQNQVKLVLDLDHVIIYVPFELLQRFLEVDHGLGGVVTEEQSLFVVLIKPIIVQIEYVEV